MLSLAGAVETVNLWTLVIGLSSLAFLSWARTGLKPLHKQLGVGEKAATLIARAGPVFAVAAITYYLVGLIGIVLKGLPDILVKDAVLLAALTPLIAVLVWWATRQTQSALRQPHP